MARVLVPARNMPDVQVGCFVLHLVLVPHSSLGCCSCAKLAAGHAALLAMCSCGALPHQSPTLLPSALHHSPAAGGRAGRGSAGCAGGGLQPLGRCSGGSLRPAHPPRASAAAGPAVGTCRPAGQPSVWLGSATHRYSALHKFCQLKAEGDLPPLFCSAYSVSFLICCCSSDCHFVACQPPSFLAA